MSGLSHYSNSRVAPEGLCACHVVQRGYRRLPIFGEESDPERYLELLAKGLCGSDLSLLAYCLMPNHVHLVLWPGDLARIKEAINRIHRHYADYFVSCGSRTSQLWSPHWLQVPLNFGSLWTVVRYVELNPVRAGFVADASRYPFSSAAAHVSGQDPLGILDLERWRLFFGGENWRFELERWAKEGQAHERVRLYRRAYRVSI
ncbi:MAG: hypothetical protein GX589_01540 [Deltaproteobacteria bacterium]|nr:hypothetical protein [Deltaproteobacteria bacterium]